MKASVEYLCDVLIIGSGAAGLSLALRLADQAKVLVLSKGPISEGATLYAQGGIAAVFDETDSIESHVSDTLNAGAGLCDPAVVEFTARNARDSIQWLIQQGVPFDQEEDAEGESHYHLTREGGHSHRRIFHAADATGKKLATMVKTHQFEAVTEITVLAQDHPRLLSVITGACAAAGGNIVAMTTLLFTQLGVDPAVFGVSYPLLMAIVAYLMVSHLHYPNFKGDGGDKLYAAAKVLAALMFLAILWLGHASLLAALAVAIFSTYAVLGIVNSLLASFANLRVAIVSSTKSLA